MTVGILTMFNGLSSTYSLVNVVADHVKMLLENDVKVKILVTENLKDTEKYGVFLDKRIIWVKIKNKLNGENIRWFDYSEAVGSLHKSFSDEVDLYSSEFMENLKGCDVCMMHDILYQGWHLVHNVAIRKAQKNLPHLKFIAFTHSLPVKRPIKMEYPFSERFSPMENTIFAYPTYSGLSALSKQYNVPEGNCRVIYNSIPLIDTLSDDVKKINEKFDLLSSEILVVYPGRLTTGKKFEKVAALSGGIATATGKRVKIVFCDFPSADIPSPIYKEQIIDTGINHGLTVRDILFTSDAGFPSGFPRKSVLDLFTLSNLFICPSFSESFGLTVLEAGSRGNFIVLNEAVPALFELGKKLHSYFLRWDARNFEFDTVENYIPSEKDYYIDHGKKIADAMFLEQSIFSKTAIRVEYSHEWIWKNQLEPMISCSLLFVSLPFFCKKLSN